MGRTAPAYNPPMRRALTLLLLLPLRAAAGDAAEDCARLADRSPAEVRRAVESLRRADPGAEEPLRELAASGSTEASLAGAIVAARRLDPEFAVPDIEIFLLLQSPDPAARQAGVVRAVALGSVTSGRMLARWLDGAAGDDRRASLLSLATGAGRDPGWAREALRHVRSPSPAVRDSAALALAHHAVRGLAGDIRLAIEREDERTVRLRLWAALLTANVSPSDLPALPSEPEEAAPVLAQLAGIYSPELRRLAWTRAADLPPGAVERWLWDDPARLARCVGPEGALALARRGGGRARYLPPGLRLDLGDHPDPDLRRAVALIDGFTPVEIARGATFLGDPSEPVRVYALQGFDRWRRNRGPTPADERMESLLGLAAAMRACLDSAAGPGSPAETAWAVRRLLEDGSEPGPGAGAAYQALWLVREDAVRILAGLEKDPDVGGAARRVAILLRLGVPPEAAYFQQGLQGQASVRAGQVRDLSPETWGDLASSADPEERRVALALTGDAWDRLEGRAEVTRKLLELSKGEDAAASQAAIAFLLSTQPGLAPERPEMDNREVGVRPRAYVTSRLRAAAGAPGPLDRQRAAQIGMLGDRAAVLAALQGGKAVEPVVLGSLFQRGSHPMYVPALLDALEGAAESSLTLGWFQALASSGAQGSRIAAAFAREGSRQARIPATAALLSRAWCDPLSAPLLERAAEDAESRAVLVEALRFTYLRSRPALSPRCAAAFAAFLLALQKDESARPDLERIFGSLGQGLDNAEPATLEALGEHETIRALARAAGISLDGAGNAVELAFLGDRAERSRALLRLPARSLLAIHVACLSALRCGNVSDSPEYYALEKSAEYADIALVAWAADDPENREELLRIRRNFRRWGITPAAPEPTVRVVEATIPEAFDGPSARARFAAATRAPKAPSAAFMSLCAAAFRGAAGDEPAVHAVLPRLGPDALPALLPLLNAPDAGTRGAVARAAGALGREAPGFARAGLRASLDGERERPPRAEKLAALLALGDAEGSAGIRALAESSDPDDRLAAARALGTVRRREALEILAGLAEDADFAVRDSAGAALRTMTRRELPPETPPWEAADWRAWLRANPGAPAGDPPAR